MWRASKSIGLQSFAAHRLAAAVVGCCLAAVGCGGDGRVAVEATITQGGKPVADGTLVLSPAEGAAGPRAIGAVKEGEVWIPAAEGPVAGKYVAQLTTNVEAANRSQSTGRVATSKAELAGATPARWSVTITDGKNRLTLDVDASER